MINLPINPIVKADKDKQAPPIVSVNRKLIDNTPKDFNTLLQEALQKREK